MEYVRRPVVKTGNGWGHFLDIVPIWGHCPHFGDIWDMGTIKNIDSTHITQTHKESLDSRTSRPLNSRPSATSRVLATDQHLHPTSARERAPETLSQTSDTLSHAHTPRGTPLSGAAHHKPFPCSRAVSRPTRKPSTSLCETAERTTVTLIRPHPHFYVTLTPGYRWPVSRSGLI